MLPNKH